MWYMSINSVLKSWHEVATAKERLKNLNLFPHHGKNKSWDTYKMIEIIRNAERSSVILDVGCNGSPILPILKKLGFKNLYGCDLVLKPKYNTMAARIVCMFYRKEYRPIVEMYKDKSINLTIQNIEKTNYPSNLFDYVTSLSVIEHGVDLKKYFLEMSRILKPGGYLLTSTDYWPDKVLNLRKVISSGKPDNIFSKNEIEELIAIAQKSGFKLIEPVDYTYGDKVVHWKETGLDYTFIFLGMQKSQGSDEMIQQI